MAAGNIHVETIHAKCSSLDAFRLSVMKNCAVPLEDNLLYLSSVAHFLQTL